MDLQLKGRVAIITGGSRGLGYATARSLVDEGCRVAICARGAEGLRDAANALRIAVPTAEVLTVTADVSKPDDVKRVADMTVKHFDRLDIVVNNVGLARGAELEDTSDDEWQEALDQTLFPAIRMSRAAAPYLRRSAGVIVIVSSIYGREAGGRMTYNAVKAAEISLTKSLAQQLARYGIRVVGVAPGSILFPGGSWYKRQQADPEGIAEFVKRELPYGRFGRPEEVGDVIAFLSSARARWISGTTVVVDGCQSRMF